MRLIAVVNPGSRRAELLFRSVVRRKPTWELVVVPWIDLLRRTTDLRRIVRAGDVVRIDSPGQHFDVEKELLSLGADASTAEAPKYAHAPISVVQQLEEQRGRILWPRQWYLGLRHGLSLIASQLSESPSHRLLNDCADIETMFDKTVCRALLVQGDVAVSPVVTAFGEIEGWDHLVTAMQRASCNRVFIKLANGSSASGAIAYRTDGTNRHQAFTTIEASGDTWADGEPILFNSRRVRAVTEVREIAKLVNAICRQKAHAERWLPKATTHSPCGSFDLRVVVIAGQARHVVARVSRTPMTNLHLLNARGELAGIRDRMGEDGWRNAMGQCEQAMACFPRTLYGGVDLLVLSNWRRQLVLEVNAFGDLLPGVTDESGLDTYEAQLASIDAREPVTAGGPSR